MNLTELLLKRRSVRNYTDEKISDEMINEIITAGLLAPSSRNLKPVEMIVVDDQSLLEKLSNCKSGGSQMLGDASLGIVVIGDKETSDTWIEDCSIVMTIMHLKAVELGLGSCWVQCRLRKGTLSANEYISNLLNIPDQYEVLGILSLGHSDHLGKPYTLDDLDYDKIHKNNF